jgi:hypothetical protein
MPTANASSPSSAKTSAKAAGKTGARKPAARRRSTRRTSSTARSATQVKATRAAAARTRTVHQAETATKDTASVFGDYAERALLIPIGAALIARDRVLASVNNTISSYKSPSKAQAQLRRFERRGVTARKRLEREVRKTRVRVERELRQRRREIEKTVNELDERRGTVAKNVPEFANRVQERILSFV